MVPYDNHHIYVYLELFIKQLQLLGVPFPGTLPAYCPTDYCYETNLNLVEIRRFIKPLLLPCLKAERLVAPTCELCHIYVLAYTSK